MKCAAVLQNVLLTKIFSTAQNAFESGFSESRCILCAVFRMKHLNLTGIVELANQICQLGKETRNKWY